MGAWGIESYENDATYDFLSMYPDKMTEHRINNSISHAHTNYSKDKDPDEWVFIGNVMEGEVKWDTITVDPRAGWIGYIELVYYQICEALHAPLLLYLKNATEASANVMMEAVDRYVQGIQRYIKRRVERYLFEPQCGEPVPRLVWGQPKTGLEEVTLTDIAAIFPYLAPNQQQELMQQFGFQLPDAEWPKQPAQPMQQPFQKAQSTVPVERVLEKLNDVETGLHIILTNYREKHISITEAMRLADRTVTAMMKHAYPSNWKARRDAKFKEFARKLIPVQDGKLYSVSVNE